MDTANNKLTSARAFIRSLNILLKYARLYSFDHTRTAEQFTTAWNELHQAIPITNENGLLLSATGSQLLLDGAPIDSSPAERSFAQLLSAAGLASIQFTARVTKDDLERLVRAFPTHNTKPTVLAEQLKAALANVPGIRINEIRYVAEDSSMSEGRVAGLLMAQTLGLDSGSMKDWLTDPQKLLQLIAAAEGSRTEPGGGGIGEGTGTGSGVAAGEGSLGSEGSGGTGSGGSGGGGSLGSGGTGSGGIGSGGSPGSGRSGAGLGSGGGLGSKGNEGSGASGSDGSGGGGGEVAGVGGAGGSGGAGNTGAGIGIGALGNAGIGQGRPGIGGAGIAGTGNGGTGVGGAGVGGTGGVGTGSAGTGGAGTGGAGTGGAGTGGAGTGGAGTGGVGAGGAGTGTGGTGGIGTGVGGTGIGAGGAAGTGDGSSQRGGGPGGTGKFAKNLGGTGSGIGGGGGRGAGGSGGPNKTGSGFSPWSTKDEDILGILKLLTHLGHTVITSETPNVEPGPLQEELTKLPAQSHEMLRQALAAVAAQAPAADSKDPMLLRLAQHLAVRFALERYQRGEVKVNAVRKMIERMSQEIDGLRTILGIHEQKLADAGVIVESSADMLDRQFWAAVPEQGKRAVLTSSEAWCIPARNLRQYVEELIERGDEKLALEILQNYASSIQSPENEARRRTAIGLADLADLYASFGGRPLSPAIQLTGAQLSLERDDNLQGMISAAFVRLAQEAAAKRLFPAMLQALDSLDAVENQRPVFAQNMRPRIGLEKRIPEFLEDVLRGKPGLEGLDELLQRVPRAAAENLVLRFSRTANRVEMQRLTDLARAVGNDVAASMRDTLRSAPANEAAETVGLLSRLDPFCIERWAPDRLAEWPRNAQDRVVRLLAMGGAPERGSILTGLLHLLDPVLLALAIDEIGLSEDAGCIPALLRLAEGDMSRSAGVFMRLKAVEALGRLKAQEAAEMLKNIAESRHMFHWSHHAELRLAALQSLTKIDSTWAGEFLARSGFSASDLSLTPLDPLPNAKYFRRRRYPRVRLSQTITAVASTGQDSYRLEIRGLSLSGGIAVGEKHMQPGTLVSMKIGSGLRPIRAQVLMRDARAQGLGFEIADMDLDERARLRKFLLENRSSTNSDEQALFAHTAV